MTNTDWQPWVGRTESHADVVTPIPVAALAATLDRDDPPPANGDSAAAAVALAVLPAALSTVGDRSRRTCEARRLPAARPLPRRMWAGGRLTFLQPLRVGDPVDRTSMIRDVTTKEGRSGPLVFVLGTPRDRRSRAVRRSSKSTTSSTGTRRQQASVRSRRRRAPVDATWTRTLRPDDVLLFRYSALTFNGHRIHYDRRYVTEVEGYPGLIVHGPLIATLLLDLVRRHLPDAVVARFAFRAMSPLFDIAEFTVNGRRDSDATRGALGSERRWRARNGRDGDAWLTRCPTRTQRRSACPLHPIAHQDIRDAIRAAVRQFPDEYFRKIDAQQRVPRSVRRRADRAPAGLPR